MSDPKAPTTRTLPTRLRHLLRRKPSTYPIPTSACPSNHPDSVEGRPPKIDSHCARSQSPETPSRAQRIRDFDSNPPPPAYSASHSDRIFVAEMTLNQYLETGGRIEDLGGSWSQAWGRPPRYRKKPKKRGKM